MHHITAVKAQPNYRIWIRFADNLEGVIDLSDLVGKGVFAAWRQPGIFEQVSIDPQVHSLVWPGGIDICPDSLYEDLTGIKVFDKSPQYSQ